VSGAEYDAEGLALHLLRSTQAAAVACQEWVGKGDSKAADDAAVKALREVLGEIPGKGMVVIGEGEKDDAPMLFQGEEVGNGTGGAFEIAVDPLEGTSYCAEGMEGAIAVIAAGPPDSLWATSSYYLDKLVLGSGAKGCIDLDASNRENLEKVAEALAKSVEDLTVVVLDKPRHEDLIAEVREAGAHVVAIPDGDVMGALRALVPGGGADMSMGVGGSPEGVITACAARLLGGDMQARLAPQKDDEKAQLEDDDADLERVRGLSELAASPDCVFVATAVTATPMLAAPELTPAGWRVHSLVATPLHAPLFVESLLPT